MLTIELQQIKLHAFHGLYPGEERLGSPYEVNLKVTCPEPADGAYHELSDTVNYAGLYEILKSRMLVPTPLLETVADAVLNDIKKQYPRIQQAEISIYKLQPPIVHFEGRVGITLNRSFHD